MDVPPLSNPYTLGQVVTGQITEKGEQDLYAFTGKAGQRLIFDALSDGAGFSASLIAPSGKTLFSGQDLRVNRPNIILDEEGTYQWVVDASGETTGNYSFRLLSYANATGTSTSNATPITLNTEVVGNFGDPLGLESDLYRFTLAANQRLYIDSLINANPNSWHLYAPNGEQITAYNLNQDGEIWLERAGEYTLELWGVGAAANNRQYQLRLTATDPTETAYTLGTTATGTIANPGEQDTYLVEGRVGQLLFLDALIGSSAIRGRLYSPSSVLVADRTTDSDWTPIVLAETGTYRLVLDGNDTTTGSYSFNLADRDQATNLTLNTPISNSLNPGNATHLYQLNGTAGQRLAFDLQAASWTGATWVLYDPSGKAIAAPNPTSPDFTTALAATGTYTLAIAGTSANPVGYGFTVTDTTPAPVTKSGFNQVESGSFASGQVATHTFTAPAGTVLAYDGMNASEAWVRVKLLNPDGTEAFGDGDARFDREPITLQQTGTYTLQFFGYYNLAGNYSYKLLELPKALGAGVNYLEVGSPVTGTLANGEDKLYSFQALPGMTVMFNGMIGTGLSATLYDANGNLIFNQDNFSYFDNGLHTLTRSDLYHLRIRSPINTSSNYSFQLLETTTAPAIPANLPVSGSLSNGQLGALYTLQAEKGQTLYFDNLAYSSTWGYPPDHRWILYSPGNQTLVNQALSNDFQVVAPETGEYRLYVQGTYVTNPVDYRFRTIVQDPPLAADVITPGTGETSSASGTLGQVGVTLAAVDDQGATATQSYTIRLWPDPENASPTILSTPSTRFALDDQTYRYQVRAIDPDQDTLTYRLVDAPLGALIQSDTGEILWFPESTVTPGSRANFTVEVSDRRGGSDTQTFGVDVYGSLGTLQGAVFDDLNGNGFRDSKLIRGENPAILLALDVSGSTEAPFYGQGEYDDVKTVLDAQRAATLTLIDSLVAQGAGNTVQIGLIPHEFNATIQDMNPWAPGLQPYTTALADNNNNGIADIREILQLPTYTIPNGSNRFIEAIGQINSLVTGYAGTPNLIFMSDGYTRDNPTDLATAGAQLRQTITNRGGNVTAFAIGDASTETTLRQIDPTAIQLTDINELVTIFQGLDDRYAIEPLLEGVTVYLDQNNNSSLDDGESFQITRSPSSVLPTSPYYYRFDNLLPGTYQIRTVVPNGYTLTAPVSGVFTHTITAAGETYSQLPGISQIATPPNANPVFITEPVALTALKGGDRFRYEARAIDADADLLTYDLVLAPNGLTVDPEQGSVVWNPTVQQVEAYYAELRATQERLRAIGREASAPTSVTFQAILRAQDGQGGQALQTINLELLPDNRAPLFTSTFPEVALPQVGKVFQYQATATDPDGDALTYSLINAPTGMTIAPTTGILSWTPTAAQVGERLFQIKVTDGKGGETLQLVNATVIPPQPNQLPVITSSPRATTRLETPYFYEVLATDPDGDALSYSLVNAPTGMTLQGNILSWLPGVTQSGSNPVVVRVTDSQGGTVNQSFAVNVSHQAVNNAPVITSAPSFLTNLERQYQYNLTGTDPDGDLLAWGLDQAPEGMTIDAKTGALRWQPSVSQIGDHTIAVRLSDHTGLFTVQEYDLTVRGANTPPQIVSVPITQAAVQQAYQYQVVATDPEGDDLTYSLVSRPTGMTIDSLTGLITWTPSSPSPVTVEVQARDSQGAVSSQRYTLAVGTTAINRAPSITSIPGLVADTNGSYTYEVAASDPEQDALTYGLDAASLARGMTVNTTTGEVNWLNPVTGNYSVVVTASDGVNTAAQGYQLVARANQVPLVRSTNPPTAATVGVEYRYDVIASDPDGGSLTYQLDQASLAKGMTLDGLGRLRWTPTAAQIGNHPVTLSLTDAAGAQVQQAFTLAVQTDTVAPQVQLQFAGNSPANLGDTVTFKVLATDNVGIQNLQLLVNGTPIALNSRGIATYTITQQTPITAVATAIDTGGNSTQSTPFNLSVINPNDSEAPAVSLSNLPEVVTAPINVIGTVDATDLDYYVLEVAPIDGSEFREVFRSSTPVTNGILGKFDPSTLQNDAYLLRLRAVDINGNQSFVDTETNVQGDLKLGNFTVSFTDLEIPVSGIPISVTRTYDSLNAAYTDDFGYGWRLEFRDTDLRTSLRQDETYDETDIRTIGFKDGTKVFITLPGGQREAFTFKPTPSRVNAYLREAADPDIEEDVGIYLPAFVPDKGVTSTLTVANTALSRTNGRYSGFGGTPYNPADSYYGGTYILTTKEGIRYEISGTTGDLMTVSDTNGNTLTFTDAGITSNTGASVTFERDAQNRITSVIDPLGQKVSYRYDANGDLIAVTDRETNTTQFEYDTPNQPHYLNEIIDPLGRSGIRTEYDEQGRLKKLIDAAGNPVELTYDPANFVQTVKDALNYPTTYEYDTRGNIVTEVDALGGITRRTYDEENNLLSETDPEGRTRSYAYDGFNNKLRETDGLGNTTTYTYGALSRLLSETDPLGNTTYNTYSRSGNLTSIADALGHRTYFSYDLRGQLLTAVDALGQATGFEYDSYGRITRSVDALGNATSFTYDANGNQLSETRTVTTPTGLRTLTTSNVYDANSRLLSTTDAEGHTTRSEYNALGQQVTSIDALGHRTAYIYDDKGQQVRVIYADGTATQTIYDAKGQEVTTIDQLGRQMHMVYDALGRVIETIAPDSTPNNLADNPRTRTEYDKSGMAIAQIDERGNRTTFTYDLAGRQTALTNALNQTSTYTYDAAGRRVGMTDALNRTTGYTFDAVGRLIETQFADGTHTNTTYDALGRRIAATDQAGVTTQYEYDALNRLTAVVDALNQHTNYSYDELGRLITQTDANNHSTQYEYDGVGRRTATILPLGQRATMDYNGVGNLVSHTDFNGDTITYDYDVMNRLVAKQFPDSTATTYTYTPTGQRASITDNRGVTTYAYDERERLISRTDPDGRQISYTYDLASNRTSVTIPSGTTIYTFDALNRLDTVTDPNSGLTDYTYDAVGNLIRTDLPNGTYETRDVTTQA